VDEIPFLIQGKAVLVGVWICGNRDPGLPVSAHWDRAQTALRAHF
jgi:hypothetical protein